MNLPRLYQSIHGAAELSYSRSGGPGGQNVNKVNTKVTLRLRLEDLEGLSEAELEQLRQVLAPRISGGGDLLVASDEERSQRTNRERAFSRMKALVAAAARLPKHRRPVKPSRASREQRLRSKRIQGRKKSDRRFSPEE